MAKKAAKKVAKKAKKTVRKAPKKAAKKTIKKTPKKVSRKVAKKPPQNNLPVTLFVIAVAIIIIALVLIFSGSEPDAQSTVAASVNGVEITAEQLETQYAILPEEYKAIYSKELILQQLIDEELLITYGAEQGQVVSEESVNEEIQRILATGELTVVELEDNLNRFNLSLEDFEALIERKLLIELSMSLLLADMGGATETDARAFYDANIAQYAVEEQVTARHILIASQRENAAQFSKDVMKQLQDGADFCKFVTDETDDKGSVDNCGEYTFPRGYMVPEFEKASFEMAVGDFTIVQTVFGYHIIEKLADVPARTTEFADVKDDILAQLNQQEQVNTYKNFLDARKLESNIQIFYKE
jgi:parvulin-like peptidyl-prolyl isomerase